MASVQSSIRAEVKREEFPAPKGAEVFAAYAIASAKDLIPEMENAASLTLNHPMSFEFLGETLRFFEGWALRDLVNFRKRCGDNPQVVTCLDSDSFFPNRPRPRLRWENQLVLRPQNDLKLQMFTHLLSDALGSSVLHGAREQVGASTRQGNLFPLLFEYDETYFS
jgi:hypothetical protein